MNQGYKNIADHVAHRYGVSAMGFDPTPIAWAANELPRDIAKVELKALNTRRERSGLIPVTFPWGHPLF